MFHDVSSEDIWETLTYLRSCPDWMSGDFISNEHVKIKKWGVSEKEKKKEGKKEGKWLSVTTALADDYFSESWSSRSTDWLGEKIDIAVLISAWGKSLPRKNLNEFISQLLKGRWNKQKIKRIVLYSCRRLVLRLFRWNLSDLTHQSVFSTRSPVQTACVSRAE